MKFLHTFNRVAQCLFRLFAWGVVFVLCLKSHWLNNWHDSLRQDKMECWLALGIAYLLALQLMTPRVSRGIKTDEHPERN